MPKPGKDLPKNPDETVEDIIGTECCEAAKMSGEQRNLTLRDVMHAVDARFDHPDGKGGKTITGNDWKVIIKALECKTGWVYKGRGPASCCCSWG